jgi:hypothetical protein
MIQVGMHDELQNRERKFLLAPRRAGIRLAAPDS